MKQTIPRLPNREAIPLSFAQQRLWFFDQLEPNGCVYNTPRAWRLTGALIIGAIQQALDAIVVRHEVLRTHFSLQSESPVQMIHESRPVNLPLVDLSQSGNCDREAELARLVCDEARRPFDLARDPMLRARLFRLDQDDHVLLCTMHHIATDGWSLVVFYQELATFYNSYCDHNPASLPELPIQYSDYAVWQRQHLRGEVLERQLVYWKERLQDAPGLLNLPTDRPRPPVQSYNGARRSVRLAHSLIEGLKTLSRRQSGTLFMTMLAAWQTLLYRYTNQSDIVVGVPTAGRKHLETEKLIGFFVNTLALRTDLSGDPTFSELLARVSKIALEAFEHDDLPFERLVEELQPERSLSHSPLIQVLFAFQNLPQNSERMHGIEVKHCEVDAKIAKFDLTLSIRRSGEGQLATMEYNTDLFDGATIERMLGHYQTLLQAIAADPEERLSELPILTQRERQQLLVEWNDTKRDYPKDKCIHELFEEQVEKTPDAVAVVFEGRQLTYRELNKQANRLAHYLHKRGVGPEVLVGLCVERSLEMIVGVLAILKAGGAYVPLDPRYPTERLRFVLEDARARVVLTRREWIEERKSKIEGGDSPSSIFGAWLDWLSINGDWDEIEKESAENVVSDVGPSHLAYVIYTSGSTGRPKGVLIKHEQIVNYLYGIRERYELAPGARYAMVQPLTVDSSQTVIFPPLICGGVLHLLSEERAMNGQALADYFVRWPIDLLKIAPSHLAALQQTCATPAKLLPLRWLIVGGEASQRAWMESMLETAGCAIFNHYGPTEATVGMLTYSITKEAPIDSSLTVPVGRPLPNTEVFVLDRNMQPVPVGVAGQLYIGGSCLARGYLNLPELTAEKFIVHSFDGMEPKRLYRTGDLARYLADGNIEFLGRVDNQVKIRGYRIELGEIEAVLTTHLNIHEAIVIAGEDAVGDKRLVAYVVAKEFAPAVSDLRTFLKVKLPDYMVPSAFVFLKELPLTAHGKLDRKALPDPDYDQRELTETFVAPRNAVEESIAAVWSEVLGKPQIGVHDNFFDLGGHSLKATQVVSRLRKKFRNHIPLRHIFEYPTIAEFAAVLGQQQEKEKDIDRLLSEIETLTEEEAQKQLAGKSNSRDNVT